MIKVLATQFRNESLRLKYWLTYNLSQGVDFFILFDDFSNDDSEAIIRSTLPENKFALIKTDGVGKVMGTVENKPGYAAIPEETFHVRICRSFDVALQTATKAFGDCMVGFFDVDEFLHTPDPATRAWDLLHSFFETEQCGYVSINSLDISDKYEIKDRNFILSDACNYRWCFDEFKGNDAVHNRHKSACRTSIINRIPIADGSGIHTCGQAKPNFVSSPDRLRIHHYRKPSIAPRFSCFDDTLTRKLKAICF